VRKLIYHQMVPQTFLTTTPNKLLTVMSHAANHSQFETHPLVYYTCRRHQVIRASSTFSTVRSTVTKCLDGPSAPTRKNTNMTDSVSPNGNSEAAEVKKVTNPRLSRFGSIAKYPDDSNVGDGTKQAPDEMERSYHRRLFDRVIKAYWDNEFVCLAVIVILLAYAYPPLGATYLAPDITASWIAVILIFSKWLY
jgi:hypothetical protein